MTEQRRAQDHLDTLIEVIPVGIIRTDTSGRCVSVNERWCRLAGIPRDRASGDGWLEALHEDDRERASSHWKHIASQPKEFADEFRFQTPDGQVRVISTRALPLFDEDGKLVGHLGAVADVTERQETEKALRKLAHELAVRIKELNCLFGISHIVEQSGGSLPDILRETVSLLPTSWDYPEIACARIVMNGREFKTDNFSATRWLQAAEIFVHGEEVGVIEVCYLEERPLRDEGPFLLEERNLIDAVAERLGRIAERLRAEQLLLEREQELRQRLTHLTRVSILGEMASGIAHEVNQPLTAVATYAQACRRLLDAGMTDSTELLDVLQRISDEAQRAGDIIHHLKDLVRGREANRMESDINELIHDVERLASVDARLRGVTLRLELASDLPTVVVDRVQIQQVVLNLIRNGIDALKATDAEHKEVVVRSIAGDSNEVQVAVSDNGTGLPENVEDSLFEPFFTTKEDGMGMGLSISRSIVTSHGGRLWFSRNPERGTTFFFTVPAAEDDHDTH
ncbi:MAG: PAS domain S-box protein [Gemmatimonadota bacterium]|nr:MAG: PAS domain S-box protein [Gemmatimonadota bacterium]